MFNSRLVRKQDAALHFDVMAYLMKFSHILYDPRDCAEPGHLTATITLKLAELRLSGFKPETDFTDDMKRKAALTAAVYNRQGFVLANLPDQVATYLTPRHAARAIPSRFAINTLCFATCLALRVRRQTPEHIIGTYGTRMTLNLRSKIHQACRQIDMDMEALEILQMLAEKNVRPQKLIQSA